MKSMKILRIEICFVFILSFSFTACGGSVDKKDDALVEDIASLVGADLEKEYGVTNTKIEMVGKYISDWVSFANRNVLYYTGEVSFANTENDRSYSSDIEVNYNISTEIVSYSVSQGEFPLTNELSFTLPSSVKKQINKDMEKKRKISKNVEIIDVDINDFYSLNGTARLYHVTLSNSDVKYLEEIFGFKPCGKNLYIYHGMYELTRDTIANLNESLGSKNTENIDGDDASYDYFASILFQDQLLETLYFILDSLSVDNLPEKLYPINDKHAEERLMSDITTSKAFLINILANTVMEYNSFADLNKDELTRKLKRMNANLDSKNKALFKTAFPTIVKDAVFKGFVIAG